MSDEPAAPTAAPWGARAVRWAPAWLTAVALVVAGFYPVGNSDTFGHLAVARYMVENRTIPHTDPFSFFRGGPQPWLNFEWLSELVLWGAYSLGGVNGLLALRLALLALFGWLVAQRAADGVRMRPPGAVEESAETAALLAQGAGWVCAALVMLALPSTRSRFSERPHIFGFVLAALYLLVLPRVGAGRYARPWPVYVGLALAHVAWVNSHGSHLFGLVLTGAHLFAYLTARDRAGARALAIVTALQCLATAVTPYGPKIVLDAIELLTHNEYRVVLTEWAPLSRASAGFVWFAFVTGVLCVAAAARPLWRAGGAGRAGLLVSAVLAVMALRSQRFLADFLVLSAGVVAAPLWRGLSSRAGASVRRLPYVLAAGALGVSLALGLRYAEEPFGAGLSRVVLPLGCGRWINEHVPTARVLGSAEDAWYVQFAAPRSRTLIDGRVQLFGAAFVGRVLGAVQNVEGLRGVGSSYPIDAFVTRHTSEQGVRMTAAAFNSPDWVLVFVEDEHALFLRAMTPERAEQLARIRLRALPAGYDPRAPLDPARSPEVLRAELRSIADPRDGVAYRAWVNALLELRPMAREGGRAGFAPPATPGERAAASRAASLLGTIEPEVDTPPPVVAAYRALAAAAACDLDLARESLGLARERGGETRETVFGELELALREGGVERVRSFVRSARASGGEIAEDPWVSALEASLRAPPRCP